MTLERIDVAGTLVKIEEFLKENGFKTDYTAGVSHFGGMNRQIVRINPSYNPYDDAAHIIGVSFDTVMSYSLSKPYNHHHWIRRWEKHYSTKDELLAILKEELNPKSCWS